MMQKFRAWDKPTESMQKVESVDFKNHTVDLEGGEIEQYFDDVILMQATGLQDRNNVDIYEGDIVRLTGAYEDFKTGIVEFRKGAFVVNYESVNADFNYFDDISLPIEVIGNIYENPNLLEEQS